MAEKSDKIELFKHFKNYFVSNFAVRAVGFVSIPVFTRLLTPEEYGIYSIYITYVSILMIVFSLNLHGSVSRYSFEYKEDFKEFLGTSVVLVFGSFFVFSSFFIVFKGRISELLDVPSDLYFLFLPSVFFALLTSLFTQVFYPRQESARVAKLDVLNSYGAFLLSVLIVMAMDDRSYRGPVWGRVVVGGFFAVYVIRSLSPFVDFKFKSEHFKYILTYSLPLMPYALSGVLLEQADRLMINSYLGASDAGLYSLAYNIGMLQLIVIMAINSAWTPTYFKYMNSQNFSAHDKDTNYLFSGTLCFATFLIFFGKELGLLLSDENYYEALVIVPVVVVGYVFHGIFYIYSRNIGYGRKTIYLTLIVLLSGLINIFLNYKFIPIYGYYAGAYTTLFSYFFMALLSWIVSRYLIGIYSTPIKIIVTPILIFVSFIVSFYFLQNLYLSTFNEMIIKSILLLFFVFLLFRKNVSDFFATII